MSAAYLHVRRVNQWLSRFRKFRVKLDGAVIGKIKHGATGDFEISPGDHELVVSIDWVSSEAVAFSCKAGEHVRFVCGHPDATWRAALDPMTLVDTIAIAPDVICSMCGYCLFGLSENRCPECGTSFDSERRPTMSQ